MINQIRIENNIIGKNESNIFGEIHIDINMNELKQEVQETIQELKEQPILDKIKQEGKELLKEIAEDFKDVKNEIEEAINDLKD